MTDEQIDDMLSVAIIRPISCNAVEPTKSNSKIVDAKTPLELLVNALNVRNSKQPSLSEHWVDAIFDNAESLLGKDKVNCDI